MRVTMQKVITDEQANAHDCSRDDHLWDHDDIYRWCVSCGLTRKKLLKDKNHGRQA